VRSVEPNKVGSEPRAAWKSGAVAGLLGVLLIVLLTWLWQKTQSINPEDHSQLDAALRELRSLDRTINQDVLRARYQMIASYDPVLRSYRRVEELEAIIATPLPYLDAAANQRLAVAVRDYRASVTAKQGLIERFKYRTADLRELLGYLPSAGAGVAKAALDSGDGQLAANANEILQMTLLYNLTSDEKYARFIRNGSSVLAVAGEQARSYRVKRRIGTLVLDLRRLLIVKPAVEELLLRIFHEPIIEHEDEVANIYYADYAAAERTARVYRVVLYGVCIALLLLVAYGVRRLQHTARALAISNERLEERVIDRTRELDARNREMRAVLNNVDQALFTVDLAGRLSRERSAALDAWFPHAVAGTPLADVFKAIDPEAGAWLSLGWEQLHEGILPLDLTLDQLPKTLFAAITGRHYRVGYRPIEDGPALDKILIVISDVTATVERDRRDVEQQEDLMIFQHVMIDGHDFEEFFGESDRLVDIVIERTYRDPAELIRALHTVKGNAGMYGVTSVVAVCHELESKIVESGDDLAPSDRERLVDVWSAFAKKIRVLAGTAPPDRLEITRADLQSLRQAIAGGKSPGEMLQVLRQIEREPVERRLARMSEQARRLGARLGKGEVVVTVESNGVRLDGKRWAPFWGAFVHALRNALDHGIEPPEARRALGKPETGCLSMITRELGDRVIVEISDDGRGIDWDAVRARAAERGLGARTEDELLAVLLDGGLSTKSEVTEVSGRGSGLRACHLACADIGGAISVVTHKGRGTTFRFSIPSDDSLALRLTSAA
jgi:HPt (histidine-containing phosphotransfer) domain-containing protein